MNSTPKAPSGSAPSDAKQPPTVRVQNPEAEHENVKDLRSRLLKMILNNEQMRQSQVSSPNA